MLHRLPTALALLGLVTVVACAHDRAYIAGTRIPENQLNQSLLGALEDYRHAMERGDAKGLVLMASPKYSEDSGTPTVIDDYGFDGLQGVLATRFQQARDLRYSMKYVAVKPSCDELQPGCLAKVDVLIDASFTITDARGQSRRLDKRDQNQLVLEYSGTAWQFLSGM
jgi:hypothetical protein